MHMNRMKLLVTGAFTGALLAGGAGGAIGAVLAGAAPATTTGVNLAASTSSTPSTTTPSTTAPANGTFKPNEDPTHEAGESAAREAQENAGQVPTVP
jgi:ABC-type transport system substrate-binding protein